MIQLLIFDLDGTLLDTIQDITDAVNYAVHPFGVPHLSVEKVMSMVGSGISNLITGLIPDDRSPEKGPRSTTTVKQEAVNRFLEYYSAHLLDSTRPYPQVAETLARLGAYKKAVISNKRESLSRKVLEGSGIAQYFDCILGSDSVPEKKPSPVPVFEVLKRLNVSKENTVMVGDSTFDIEAGKNAGIRTIAVTYGFRDRSVLQDADYMADSFGELLDLLPKI